MYTLSEVIKTKITELFDAIHYVTDDLKIAGAEANLEGDFSQVTVINDSCRKLQKLEADIKSILNSFESKYKPRSNVKPNYSKNISSRTRKTGGYLRVRLAGKIIQEQTVANTFVETLRVFGLEHVAKLNRVVSAAPLLAKTPVNGYQQQKRCGDWYVTTHVNKHDASRILEGISKELNVPIQIEVVEN
jgi:hypothetical protein